MRKKTRVKLASLGICISLCTIIFPNHLLSNVQAQELDVSNSEKEGASLGEYGGYLLGNKEIIQEIHFERFFNIENTGHGFAAEQGNNQHDVWSGKKAEVVGGNNIKNGADRVVTNKDGSKILIQTKYHKTASSGISDCFDETGMFRYLDSKGNPMLIEVPADQYDDAISTLEKKIQDGKIKGITNINEAKNIIKKGKLTYQQAKNLTQAGNIDSLKYDAKNGVITTSSSMGIAFVIDFVLCQMNGMNLEESLQNASINGLKTGGVVFATNVIASQLAKTGVNNALVPTSQAITEAMGEKTSLAIIKALDGGTSAVVSKNITKKAAELLSNTLLVDGIILVVLTTDDVIDLFQGKISKEQLIKNVSVATIGAAGGTVGAIAGGTAGSAIAPGAGTTAGAIAGGIVGGAGAGFVGEKLIGLLYAGDADIMMDIISKEFASLCNDYVVNETEGRLLTEQLQNLLDGETLQEMHASADREVFAREIMDPLFEKQIKQREKLKIPSEEVIRKDMKETLHGIVFIH